MPPPFSLACLEHAGQDDQVTTRWMFAAGAWLAMWVSACGVDLPVPSGTVVTCRTSAECPAGTGCIVNLGVCSSASRACTEVVGNDLRSAPNGNACTTESGAAGTCRIGICTVCGDGVVAPGEECDDGNGSNDDACLADCSANTCGDGFVNAGVEECDDANGIDTDPCLTTCVANVCGDRIINVGVETCEDGNDDDNDGCGQCVLTTWSVGQTVGWGPSAGDLAAVDFGTISGLAVDPAGNIYISDSLNDVIWRVEASSRRVRIYAGRTPVTDDEGQPAMLARFQTPSGLAVDRLGNLYVADRFRRRIVRIDYRTQLLERVAGGYLCDSGTCGDGGPALDAGMDEPTDVSIDEDGGLYVVDGSLSQSPFLGRVRYINPQGVITSWRNINGPTAIAAYAPASAYFTEINPLSPNLHLLNRWTPPAAHVTLAGDAACASATTSCGDGPAAGARFNRPVGLAVTADGSVLIADRDNRKIRRYRAGNVSTIAGTGAACAGDCDAADDATQIGIGAPSAIALGPGGVIYFVENSRRVKRLTPRDGGYRLDTVGGSRIINPVYSGTAATASTFQEGRLVAAADDGTLFVGEGGTRRLYRVDTDGLIYRLSGDALPCTAPGVCGDGERADRVFVMYRDDSGLAADPAGNLYFVDGPTGAVRRIDRADNRLSTLTGGASACAPATNPCGDGGPALSATFDTPSDLFATADGSVYVADAGTFRVRRIDPSGNIATVVGTGVACAGPAACGDGGPLASATLQGPRAIAVAPGGDLYILDGDGTSTTLRRLAQGGSSVERLFASESFNGSMGLAYEPSPPSLLVGFDGEIKRYTLGGGASSFAGVTDGAGCFGGAEGVSAANWCLGMVNDVARAGTGDVFFADYDSSVFRIDAAGVISTAIGRTDPLGTGAFYAANLQRPRQLVRAPSSAGADTWWVANGSNVSAIDEMRDRIDAVAGYGSHGSFTSTADGTSARYRDAFAEAAGVALDAGASPARLYVSDAGENVIYRIDLVDPTDSRTWPVVRYAGTGTAGRVDAARLASTFDQPMGLAFDDVTGVLYVADRGNHLIRAISPTGVTTVAGIPGIGLQDFDVVGGIPLDEAHLQFPEGVLLEPRLGGEPNLLVADTGNHQVRRIDRVAELVFVVAGDGAPGLAGSGTARFVSITFPRSLARDSFGNLFIATGFTVRQVFAGADGIATGDDNLTTIYGNSRIDPPMSATSCLSGIAIMPGDAALNIVDVCAGYYVRLERTAL